MKYTQMLNVEQKNNQPRKYQSQKLLIGHIEVYFIIFLRNSFDLFKIPMVLIGYLGLTAISWYLTDRS